MPVPSWTAPFSLTSPLGSLTLQDGVTLDGYVADPTQCDVGTDLRVQTDDIPQGDGGIIHRRYRKGMILHYVCDLYDSGAPSFGAARQTKLDTLMKHLEAIRNADGRISWTPDSGGARMLDAVRLLEKPSYHGALQKTVAFALESPFPYALTAAQQSLATITTTLTITNNGNASVFPVWKVNGASTAFTLTNTTSGLAIVYDSTRPGAAAIASGHYAEIDSFRNTVYLDGSGANLKPGINILSSDFFPLVPGANVITISGATVDPLVNDGWV